MILILRWHGLQVRLLMLDLVRSLQSPVTFTQHFGASPSSPKHTLFLSLFSNATVLEDSILVPPGILKGAPKYSPSQIPKRIPFSWGFHPVFPVLEVVRNFLAQIWTSIWRILLNSIHLAKKKLNKVAIWAIWVGHFSEKLVAFQVWKFSTSDCHQHESRSHDSCMLHLKFSCTCYNRTRQDQLITHDFYNIVQPKERSPTSSLWRSRCQDSEAAHSCPVAQHPWQGVGEAETPLWSLHA